MRDTNLDETPNIVLSLPEDANLSLPSPELRDFYYEESQRRIWLDDTVSLYSISAICKQILTWNFEDDKIEPGLRKPIKICFCSMGGDLEAYLMLKDIIKLSLTPVIGIVVCYTASAAAYSFLQCHKKYMLSSAKILFHYGSISISNDAKSAIESMKKYEEDLDQLIQTIKENSNFTEEDIKVKLQQDWELNTKEMIEHQMIDGVVDDLSLFWEQIYMDYKGYEHISLNDEELAAFYEQRLNVAALTNQYIIIHDKNGSIVDRYCFQDRKWRKVVPSPIYTQHNKPLRPRNEEQILAFDMLRDPKVGIKVIAGRQGSGKSLAMINQSIHMVEEGMVDKIVYVRNNVEVRDTPGLGFLPGTEFLKLKPYLMQFADHIGGEDALESFIDRGILEPIHLGYIRGRDIRNAIIYCTEAQNLTVDHMKLLVGRVGEGSQLWLDGDFLMQVDKPIFEKSNGLQNIIEKLKGNPNFGYVELQKSERSEIAALADLLQGR